MDNQKVAKATPSELVSPAVAKKGGAGGTTSTPSAASATLKGQQRYSSDDLYKPRPILMGSRSRRRGYEHGDM